MSNAAGDGALTPEARPSPFDFRLPGPKFVTRGVLRLLGLHHLQRAYEGCEDGPPELFAQRIVDWFDITVKLSPEDQARIPSKGPLVVVSNHPFGGMDGMILAALLQRIRPDVKIVVNKILGRLHAARDLFIPVDAFGGEGAARANLTPLREALRWVRRGGALAIFPAGEVSSLSLKNRGIQDPPWMPTASAIARRSEAPVLPMRFMGHNSLRFQLAGLIHPRLRTALLPREMPRMQGKVVEVRIGNPIAPSRVARIGSDAELTSFLRQHVDLLKSRGKNEAETHEDGAALHLLPIEAAQPPEVLRAEVDALGERQVLVRHNDFRVVVATAEQCPNLLRELGRLREETFRKVGEGTGESLDMDRFDSDYFHLVLWNDAKNEVAGSYRLGCTDRILREQGPQGLYSTTLWHIQPTFFTRMGPALELGRSFVCENYQRGFGPLMLLWKGIGGFVREHPHYRYLFGPVSISSRYTKVSRGLIVKWLERNAPAPEFSCFVRPRTPLKVDWANRRRIKAAIKNTADTSIDDLSSAVADLEFAHRGVPVLVREYLKLGGRFAGFNRDPDFSDVFDGLVMVDLFQTPRRTLDRYMGKEGAESFLAYHRTQGGLFRPPAGS